MPRLLPYICSWLFVFYNSSNDVTAACFLPGLHLLTTVQLTVPTDPGSDISPLTGRENIAVSVDRDELQHGGKAANTAALRSYGRCCVTLSQ